MDQETALKILQSGQSVFLTGAAGAGKTHTLNEFIRWCRKHRKKVAKTATTGLAATHLNGNTIHSWSGIGIRKEIPHNFFEKMTKTRAEKITQADVLIIDEISMMHDFLLDMVDQVCRVVRNRDYPFGGLQVVLSGDFSQLPPINRVDSERQGGFAYLSNAWKQLDPVICYLSTQYRQEDKEFLEILNAIRDGHVRQDHAEALMERLHAEIEGPFTSLFTTNANVDVMNERRLAELEADEKIYEMTWTGNEGYVEGLKKSVLAPEHLKLKLGATVMALKNDPDRSFVNGSIGEVVDFDYGTGYPVVRFNNGNEVTVLPDTWEMRDNDRKLAGVTQVPLRLAWAITVHKSQGMTLDSAVLDLSRSFAPGMGYVALSRVKTLDSMSLLGIGRSALVVSPEAVRMNRKWLAESEETMAKLISVENKHKK